MARKGKRRCDQLPVLHPDAAGIDIGANELFVAVPPDRDTDAVRSFATFTQDLNALADWLEDCGVRSVAMESTSVYWIPVYRATILVRMIPVRPGPTSIPGTSEYGWFGREVRAAKAEAQPPTVHKSKRSRKSGRSTT